MLLPLLLVAEYLVALDGYDDEISYRSVHCCLRSLGLNPYIPRIFHALHEDDPDRCLQFVEEFFVFTEGNNSFVDSILSLDEVVFVLSSPLYSTKWTQKPHHCIYWRISNPHEIIEKEMNLPGSGAAFHRTELLDLTFSTVMCRVRVTLK